jgi:heparosan-N-sulfate-glucuronate 5-epimerase
MPSRWFLFFIAILLLVTSFTNITYVYASFVSVANSKCSETTIENQVPPPIVSVSGIPVLDYGYRDGIYVGPQFNPLTISTTAIDHYAKSNGNETAREIFLNNTNWLVGNAVSHSKVGNTVSHGNYSLLEYEFPWQYELKPPWRSAMAQALAMQALIRAHEETGEDKYLDTAKMLLNGFFIEVKDGGVTYKTPTDGWWYEEYAANGAKESRVLNGMLYTLIGLYDYYQYTNDSAAKYLFDLGVISIKKNLPLYEYKGNYSNYDILGTTNPLTYHKAHIETLCLLYDITNEEIFNIYYEKWKNFIEPEFLRRQ